MKGKQSLAMIRRVLNKANSIKKALQLWHVERQARFDPEKAIILSSDPRGGSTWLTQLINAIPATAVVWEPLHVQYSPLARRLNFSYRQFIPPDAEWPEAKMMFDRILSGRYLNTFTGSYSAIGDFKNAERLIVKFCRAHCLLTWLVRQYRFAYKPVHMIRHPLAVVASQLKQGGWNYAKQEFGFINAPFREYFEPEKDYLFSLSTKEEGLVANWCITNLPLLTCKSGDIRLIKYEDLLLQPVEILESIFSDWKIPMPAGIQDVIRKESKTTVAGSDVEDPGKQLNRWKRAFAPEIMAKLLAVLDHYEVHRYYSY